MLSEFAKMRGLKTEWKAFQLNTFFSSTEAILEVCLRIESIEEKLTKLKQKEQLP